MKVILRKSVALLLAVAMIVLAVIIPLMSLEPKPVEEALLPDGEVYDLLPAESEQVGFEQKRATVSREQRRIVRNRSPSVGVWALEFGKWCFNARDQGLRIA